jgi:hypothetical protein
MYTEPQRFTKPKDALDAAVKSRIARQKFGGD